MTVEYEIKNGKFNWLKMENELVASSIFADLLSKEQIVRYEEDRLIFDDKSEFFNDPLPQGETVGDLLVRNNLMSLVAELLLSATRIRISSHGVKTILKEWTDLDKWNDVRLYFQNDDEKDLQPSVRKDSEQDPQPAISTDQHTDQSSQTGVDPDAPSGIGNLSSAALDALIAWAFETEAASQPADVETEEP